MRGADRRRAQAQRGRGNIPAGAESKACGSSERRPGTSPWVPGGRRARRRCLASGTEHPRGNGEQVLVPRTMLMPSGTSPRMQGAAGVTGQQVVRAENIPRVRGAAVADLEEHSPVGNIPQIRGAASLRAIVRIVAGSSRATSLTFMRLARSPTRGDVPTRLPIRWAAAPAPRTRGGVRTDNLWWR